MTWRERLRLRNLEQYNSPHFLKGAVTAAAAWTVFMLFHHWCGPIIGPALSMGFLALVLSVFLIITVNRLASWAGSIGVLVGGWALLVILNQDGPLGYALTATMSLAVALEFWQLEKGDKSDGFDILDLAFDFAGWLYLAAFIADWEWLAV